MRSAVYLALLLPLVAAAQPSPADSALALDVAVASGAADALWFDWPSIRSPPHSRRAEVFEIVHANVAASYLDSLSRNDLVTAAAFSRSPAGLALQRAMAGGLYRGTRYTHDDALIRRYDQLTGPALEQALTAVATRRLVEALDLDVYAYLDSVGVFDESAARAEQAGETESVDRRIRRLVTMLEQLTPDQLRDAVAFEASPLGRRLHRAQAVAMAGIRGEMGASQLAFLAALDMEDARRAADRPDVEAGDIVEDIELEFEDAPPPPPSAPPVPPPPPSDGDLIYDVVEQQPELVGGLADLQRRVEYPPAAREAGIQGRVFVTFVIDETGRVRDPFVTRSPDPMLSEAALAAIRASTFTPGMQDGRKVRVRYALPVNFVLN